MTPGVHPLARVEAGAELASDAVVGAFAVVEKGVVVGARTRIESHAVVRTGARLGEDNERILHDVLAMKDDQIAKLYADGVLVRDPQLGQS